MKKLSILSVILLFIVLLIFNLNVKSQSNAANPLVGNWQLVSKSEKVFNSSDSIFQNIQVRFDATSTRFLEFKPNLTFETRSVQNDIYNGGIYALLNDTSFVTVHFELNGNLADVSNYYGYQIIKDTLYFYGYYLDRIPSFGERIYEKKFVDECWVKLKNR